MQEFEEKGLALGDGVIQLNIARVLTGYKFLHIFVGRATV
jgi:hypothetical protein